MARQFGQEGREVHAVCTELRWACKGLDNVEHDRNKEVDRLKSLHEEVRNVQERILAVEANEKAKGNALKRKEERCVHERT